MGTEISQMDLTNIQSLAEQVQSVFSQTVLIGVSRGLGDSAF
jgi:hypothetical protein